MGNKLIQVLFKPKRDILFEAAISASNAVKSLIAMKNESFNEMDLDVALFHKVFPNDPTSPSIYFFEQDQYLIFYPPHSKPYDHGFEDKCKFIEVLSGVLFDANSDLKMFKGDRLKVYPKDNYAPYTEDKKCVLRVCVGDCTTLIDQICG